MSHRGRGRGTAEEHITCVLFLDVAVGKTFNVSKGSIHLHRAPMMVKVNILRYAHLLNRFSVNK